MSDATWALGTGVSVTPNTTDAGVVSPVDGSQTVNKATVTASGLAYLGPSVMNTPNQIYTISGWVRGVGASVGTKLAIGSYNNAARWFKEVLLTNVWQFVSISGLSTTSVNGSLSLSLSDGGIQGVSVPLNASVYLSDFQVVAGHNKLQIKTFGSAVGPTALDILGTNTELVASSSTFSRIDIQENASGIYVAAPNITNTALNIPSSTVKTDRNGFLLIKSNSSKGSTFIIAAADSINPHASDLILTGSSDDIQISNAINSLGSNGGSVILRVGTYLLTSPINFNTAHASLIGESRGFWSAFNTAYSNGGRSLEGFPGGAKLKCTSGHNAIQIGNNSFQGDFRLSGIAVKNLYLYGYGLTGTGVYDANNTDISEISDCVFHNFNDAINIAWDTPFISGNSIQSCAGRGIVHNFVFGSITKNIIYDIGGQAIQVVGGGGEQIAANTMGSCAGGVLVNGHDVSITGNTIVGMASGNIIEFSGSNTYNCSVTGNNMSLDNSVGVAVTANTAGHGIYVHGGAKQIVINGNTINNGNTTATGYAVNLADTSANYNSVVGNVFTGGKWAGVGGVNNLGTGNQVIGNVNI
jgi:hypothetical protein